MLLLFKDMQEELEKGDIYITYRSVGKDTGIKWQRIYEYATKSDGQARKEYVRILTTYFKRLGFETDRIWDIPEQDGPPTPVRKKKEG